MVNPYAGNAATFLISTLFGLYILAVMLRFLFQLTRADFYNPFAQFVVRVTNPLLLPLRRVVPGMGGIDLAAVILMSLLQMVELWLTYSIIGGTPNVIGLLVLSVAKLLSLVLSVFFFSILIQVIISWVNPGAYNPITSLLYSLNEPLLAPARRLIPPISGLDLSPLVVIIALQLGSYLVVAPISDMGRGLL
ncbi:MAG: YggT family protein [Gammaproteobacteria bacterium]